MTTSGRSSRAAALVLALVAVGCEGGLPDAVFRWCSENQAKVAAAGLELGVFERGGRYADWKQSDPEGWKRACETAFQRG